MKINLSRKEFIRRITLAIPALSFLRPVTGYPASAGSVKEYSTSKVLGRTGIKVNVVGMGASRTQEPAIIKATLDAGVNFFDTGRSYANGKNEEMLGKVFKGIRNEVIIQSKVKIPDKEGLSHEEGRKRILMKMNESVLESLKALQTDYIDILLLHGMSDPDIITHPMIMEFLEKLKKSGKIRAHGFSSHSNQAELIERNNVDLFYDVVMPAFNHRGGYVHSISKSKNEWDHEMLIEALEKAGRNNIGVVAMKTTSGGPYKDPETGTENFPNAIKWVVTKDYVSVAAVAMANFKEIRENLTN